MGKTWNWAILGAGHIARKFAADLKLLPNASLYAVGSRSHERAQVFAAELGIPNVYGSYEELAKDPKIDIVYIASWHTSHYRNTLLCLDHGKHVLCEKPAAINGRQLEIMVQAARTKKLFFMEALWTRFLPSFRRCEDLAASGVIGELRIIESDFCMSIPYDPYHRIYNPQIGGGSLLDIGIYPVFCAMTLGSPITGITATATLNNTGVDTFCSINGTHRKGERSLLFSTLNAPGRNETLLHGSEGILRLNSHWHTPTTLDIIRDDETVEQILFDEPGNGYQYEAAEVIRCLDEGRMESGLWSTGHSVRLMQLLDTIRDQAGIVYSPEIEAV
jgi:predicted dehydrogenase